jgi:hypothetical protein
MKSRKTRRQRQNHPNGIGYSDDRQESAEKGSRGQDGLEVGALYASEKYSNVSPVYHIFKENIISMVFEPMPISFYFVDICLS